MEKILDLKTLPVFIKKIHDNKQSIVLVGGVFDILHSGHINFLTEAKKEGNLLFVFLESDESVRNKKGNNRPIHTQKQRAIVLKSLKTVDYIIPLEGVTRNNEYDKLIVQIHPSVIALTEGDINLEKRRIQANNIGTRLAVIKKFASPSTTNLIEKI